MSDTHKQFVLETLNHFRTSARSVSRIAVGIRDLQSFAKDTYGLKQSEVAVALDYLISNGWVAKIDEERTFTSSGGAQIPSTQSKYKLSAQGIAHFDGGSSFNTTSRYSGINISNIGGVVVLGNNNVVNNKYKDLFTQLDALEKSIKLSDQLGDEQKLDAAADLQTVKDQLSKDSPIKSIVTTAMGAVNVAANLAGAIDLWNTINSAIAGLLI